MTTPSNTNCMLMHKQIKVAKIELNEDAGFIQRIGNVFAPEHIPVGVSVKRGVADRAALNEWWTDRSIPASRTGVREALEVLDVSGTRTLLLRCFGLSLSDQYWVLPGESDMTWEKLNFFRNGFSEDIGNALFGMEKKTGPIDFISPDSTTDGFLIKRWKIIDGKRCLIKGGSNPLRQQPLNEVIATEIMNRLGIPCVPYSVIWDGGAPYSVCKDFVNENTDLVPAWRIFKTRKQSNSTSMYSHFVNCADALGIKDAVAFLDRMIVLDYIIANEDRHLNNFGALRNAETLEWLGMAPIYDSGSSLGYDKSVPLMMNAREVICKPFKKHHEEQLKLVSDFDWIDFAKLDDVPDMIVGVLSDENARDYMDENRIRAIAELTRKRIEHLKQLAGSHERTKTIGLNDEVTVNVAEDYR